MTNNLAFERELNLENDYKHACEFEKSSFEKIETNNDGSILLNIDQDLISMQNDAETINNELLSTTYSSYKDLFNKRYKNSFKRNLNAIRYRTLELELGKSTLDNIIRDDLELQKLYRDSIKERDLDNDGIPDRIDIDDTRNSVQTSRDLDEVKNATTASTQNHNEKTERQQNNEKKRKEHEIEL